MRHDQDAPWTGRPLRRLEDPRFLTGHGRYVADIRLPGMKELAFVRSAVAHARVRGVEPPAGKEREVFTRAHLAWVKPIDPRISLEGYRNLVVEPMPERVRYVGDLVAAVIGDTRYDAQDLADAVRVDLDELPAVGRVGDIGRAPLYDEIPDNVVFRHRFSAGDVEEALRAAPRRFRKVFRRGRVSPAPMEPRGVVASFDRLSRTLSVWSSTQTPHELRTLLAQTLGLPERDIRVIAPDVGGGFGMKSVLFREEVIVAALAIELGTPLRWLEHRRENLASSSHAREGSVDIRWAADEDGRILAMHADIISDVGAQPLYPVGLVIEPLGVGRLLPGPYRVSTYGYDVTAVLTNKCPIAPYRGVYMPTSTYVMERVMDITARELGLDPVDIRRRNVIRDSDFPWRSVTGIPYQRLSLEECLASIGRVAEEQAKIGTVQLRGGTLSGIGVANFIEVTASGSRAFHGRGMVKVPGYDSAEARIYPDGSIEVAVSGSSHGQGHRTAFAQLAADVFGVSPEEIGITQSDTSRAPYGMGTYASRGAVVVGGAVLHACDELRQKLMVKAARYLEASPHDLVMDGGFIGVRGTSRRVSLAQLAAYAYGMHADRTPHDVTADAVKQLAIVDPPEFTVSNGAHLARVEVDPETFAIRLTGYWVVEDCGRMINPLIVTGQIHGGVAQGIGEALREALVYDGEGQLLTATLMDYGLPAAPDLPAMSVEHRPNPCAETIGGFKGVGEAGTIGAVAAVANAVEAALSALGITLDEIPMTGQKIFEALRKARGVATG